MLKTVEIPLAGHPDKICDQIVDALLDEYLRRDAKSSVDIQALGSNGMVMVAGNVDSKADFDCAKLVRDVYADIGFDDEVEPFVNIERPSGDMSRVLVRGGSQGTCVVYGYATKETREFLPRCYVYANALARRLDDVRRQDPQFSWLKPDGKVQLTMDGQTPIAVTVMAQHDAAMDHTQVQTKIVDGVIAPVLGNIDQVKLFVNAGGPFVQGGFSSHAGASGRKIASDLYGGLLPNVNGGLSGKDPRKPSRAGTYMARFVAKQLVQEGVAGNVLVRAGYTLGHADPIFVEAVTGEGKDVSTLVKDRFDFRVEAIVERLDLAQPMYRKIATYGHVGREGLPWESTT